ncbi:hypothetical protein L211DRAFT_289684 [Terfezia boudieri ATCC MYA-4762]|uniref:Uncharacterized protein n=1 Tax=Terfezia boudieri ATCC MYA-4762 TaxID=1051890 RepID=A0A3N4LJ86_9PEZI|nr:hypothetical protein L211DRAFT_289684 [Terfezia boudieri ATCC MYA-4762]
METYSEEILHRSAHMPVVEAVNKAIEVKKGQQMNACVERLNAEEGSYLMTIADKRDSEQESDDRKEKQKSDDGKEKQESDDGKENAPPKLIKSRSEESNTQVQPPIASKASERQKKLVALKHEVPSNATGMLLFELQLTKPAQFISIQRLTGISLE